MGKDLRDFGSGAELSRLATDDGVLNLVRTQRLLSRYQGPGWLLGDFSQHWGDDVLRERLLWAARAIEADARLLAIRATCLQGARRAEACSC
jgi:hypothetical protein